MKYPTPLNPLILYTRESIPSLKNDRDLRIYEDNEGKLKGVSRRSKTVVQFMAICGAHFRDYRERQGFDIVEEPEQIGVYVQLGVYLSPKSKVGLPLKDADNMYTTLQEILQGVAIENDRQIGDYHVTRMLVDSPQYEYSLLCVWKIDSKTPIMDFLTFYKNFGTITEYGTKLSSMIKLMTTKRTE